MSGGFPSKREIRKNRLSVWLLRPFLDLGPLASGPLYARGIEEYWKSFADLQSPAFALQRTLPPAFRVQLAEEAGVDYAAADPRQLPEQLRTTRWQQLCEALDSWNDLPLEKQRRLIVLLHSLCMYEPALSLVPEASAKAEPEDPSFVELTYWQASARYVLGLPDRTSDYVEADMSVFESIVSNAPSVVPSAFNAAIKVFVHKAKTGAPLQDLTQWAAKAERALADASSQVDLFERDLLASRYYRAMGFLPQRHGDRAEVVRVMDLAEQHAFAMKPATSAQSLLFLENLHPLMESRTKEALWLGDHDLALTKALKTVDLDPFDSKAWVEVGEVRLVRKEWMRAAEAYATAGMLGPPASAVGRHMAGICLREAGEDLLAAFFFRDALEVDPLGISPRDQIEELSDTAIFGALKEWSRQTLEL